MKKVTKSASRFATVKKIYAKKSQTVSGKNVKPAPPGFEKILTGQTVLYNQEINDIKRFIEFSHNSYEAVSAIKKTSE